MRNITSPQFNNFTILFIISLFIFGWLVYRHHHRIQLMYNYQILGDKTPDSYPLVNKEEYNTKIRIGKREMMKKRVIVCGMVRDVEKNIYSIIKKTETIGKLFKDYRILIV